MKKAMRHKHTVCAQDVLRDAHFHGASVSTASAARRRSSTSPERSPSNGEGAPSPLRGEGWGEGYESTSRDLLTNVRLRCTSERVKVLAHLVGIHTSSTVEELHSTLRSSVNKVTLYRMLEQFADAGLVERVAQPDGVRRYEYQSEHHHHITCTDCGTRERVSVPEGTLTRAVAKSAPSFRAVTSHTLEFYGVCRGCEEECDN